MAQCDTLHLVTEMGWDDCSCPGGAYLGRKTNGSGEAVALETAADSNSGSEWWSDMSETGTIELVSGVLEPEPSTRSRGPMNGEAELAPR